MRTETRRILNRIAEERFGVIRGDDVVRAGLSRRILYRLHAAGDLVRLSRGIYQLTESNVDEQPFQDYAVLKARVPNGVLCLISALYHHELTTEIPRVIHLAVERKAAIPRIDYPLVKIYRMTTRQFELGIEHMELAGVCMAIYSPEKTIADCFRFRNRLGVDLAVEALKRYLVRPGAQPALVHRMAVEARVGQVIKPYLEALL